MAKTNRVRNHIRKLYHQQDGKCYYCGTDGMYLIENVTEDHYRDNKHLRATFDHIIPMSKGGTYRFENGVCACSRCNGIRGDMPFERFVELAPKLIARRVQREARKARLRKKRRSMFLMNSYLIARYAVQANKPVEHLFEEYVSNA